MKASLDDIDRKLLRLLQRDGRLSNSALAAKLKLSEATCHRRMQRLFDDRVVQSVRAHVDPSSVERDVIGVRQIRTFFVLKEVIDGAPLEY